VDMGTGYEERMGTEPVTKLIFQMALPAVVAQFVNLLYNIVDRIYIGHIAGHGADALAGVGICSTLIILISAFASFAGGGGAPLASMALGRGDRRLAERILGNGFTLDLFFTVILTVLMAAFMKPLLILTGASDRTLGYAVSYFSVYLTGTFFVMVTAGLTMFINAQGRPGFAMVSTLVGAGLNIGLDPLFIFTFRMGVAGAALASVISQVVSGFMVLGFLFSRKASLRLKREAMKPDGAVLRQMLALGVSPFVMASTESIIGFVLNGTLSKFGDIYVSALSVMQSCMQIVGVPLNGFSQGCTPVISYNFGRRNNDRVRKAFRVSWSVNLFYGLALVLTMMVFPAFYARIFTADAKLIETVRRTMPVFVAGMGIFGMQRACQNTFVALNEAKISLFIAFLRKIFLLVPLALILPHFMGVMGVFTAEAVADATAAVICMLIFLVRFPKILKGNAAEN
jgi:putative MATE family efflux protein